MAISGPYTFQRPATIERVNGRFVAVALAVALAGCGAVLSDAPETKTGAERETGTLTPAPVPDVTQTGAAVETPVDTRGGAGDVDALVRDHLSVLRRTSYTLRLTARYGNRTVEDVLRVESPKTYYYRRNTSGSDARVEYADGEHLYRQDGEAGSDLTRTAAPNATDRYGELVTRIVRAHLPDDTGTVVEVRYLGQPHFRIRNTYDVHPDFEGVENYSVRARVAQSGLIRSMTVSYIRTADDEETTVNERFVYVQVGETSVDRPNWVDERRNDTT